MSGVEYAILVFSHERFDVVITPDGIPRKTRVGDGPTYLVEWWRANVQPSGGDFGQWFRTTDARVEGASLGWRCQLFGEGRVVEIDADMTAPHGIPLPAMVATLNRLSHEGWEVVSVNEDIDLYRTDDAERESFPARVRYLLSRRTT